MIAISNMNLPMVCSQCRFYGERCAADKNLILESGRRHPRCPLIQLGSNAPQKPTRSPMPECKPPKDDWEIPSFMKNFKPKETITFYDMEGRPYATFEVKDEEQ